MQDRLVVSVAFMIGIVLSILGLWMSLVCAVLFVFDFVSHAALTLADKALSGIQYYIEKELK